MVIRYDSLASYRGSEFVSKLGEDCKLVSSEQPVPSLYGGAAGGPLAGLFYGLSAFG